MIIIYNQIGIQYLLNSINIFIIFVFGRVIFMKHKNNVKINIQIVTVILLIVTVLSIIITIITNNDIAFTMAVTFGTMLYHFAMRLFVGKAVGHRFNCNNFWFRQKSFEKKLYKILRVKQWKKIMPTYNPDTYSTKNYSLQEIANTMCRNEIIHEIIAVLSFVPILFSLFADTLAVFIATSVAGCLIDLIFVVMQRYNRPRIIRLIERNKKRANPDC